MADESLIGLQLPDIDELSCSVHQRVSPLSFYGFRPERQRRQGYALCVVGRVEADDLSAGSVFLNGIMRGMIMAEEDDIEPRHLLCHFLRSIFVVSRCLDSAVPSGMEQAYDNIGVFLGFHLSHRPSCT